MAEDWRVTVELEEGHDLAKELDEHELEDDAREALGQRVAVSGEGSQVFLYADTRETRRAGDGGRPVARRARPAVPPS